VVKAMRLAVRWRLQGVSRFLFTVVGPMLVTFLLIGIWHGAGMTAVAFGLLMGAAISVNHIWIKFSLPALPAWAGWLLTITVVVVGMVFSRADDMDIAARILAGMLRLEAHAPSLLDMPTVLAWLAALGAVVLWMPNSNQILDRYPVVLVETWDAVATWQKPMTWHYGVKGALVTSVIFCVAAVSIPKASQFIYYRF
jgi:alginate O-acetyltransferase complex protein AlgI